MERGNVEALVSRERIAAALSAMTAVLVLDSHVDVAERFALGCAADMQPVVEQFSNRQLVEPITATEAADPVQLQAHLADIEQQYGLPIELLEADIEYPGYHIQSIDETKPQDTADVLNGVVDAMQEMTPELVSKLGLSSIQVAGEIDRINRPDLSTKGVYVHSKHIVIDAGPSRQSVALTMFHELVHAVDRQVICSGLDYDVDNQISQYTPEIMIGQLDTPGPDRVYANQFASTGVTEDRAYAMASAVFERGIIQASDPDDNSPLQRKQEILVNRYDQLLPGFRRHLEAKTPSLRATTVERYDKLINPLDNQRRSTILSIAIDMYKHDMPFEQLRHSTIQIDRLDGKTIQVNNPVIIRDIDDDILGVFWSKQSELEINNYVQFDEFSMQLLETDDSYTLIAPLDSTDGSYLPKVMSIDGVKSQVVDS